MARATVTGRRLARRLLGNYALQIVNLGIRLFDQLLLIPLYLLAWGTELYKDYLVLAAISWFLTTCTFGTDDYFASRFIHDVSTGNATALRRHVRTGLFVSSAISVVILSLLYVLVSCVDLTRLLGLHAMSEHDAVLILVVLTLPLWGWYSVMILHDAYRAYGDFSRGECIFALYTSAQLVSVMIALLFHAPPTVVACCYGFMPIVCSVVTIIDVSRRYPTMRLGFAMPTREEWRDMVPQSLLYFTNALAPAITQNAVLIVFALFDFSAATIVTFNVCRVFTGLTRQIGAQSFSIGSGIEMARQHVQQDYEGCRRLYADTGRIVACISGALSGLSLPLAAPFIHLWTHGKIQADAALIVCFLVGIYFSSPGRASLMLLRYTNHARPIAWANSVWSLAGLALAVALAWPLDGVGVALGFAVTEMLGAGLLPPLAVEQRFRFSAWSHLLNSFLAGGLAFVVSFAAAYLLFGNAQIGVLQLALRAGLWALAVLPPLILIALPHSERQRLIARLFRRLSVRPS
ncbi:MAG TPA: hypothetical protein VN668_17280 [Stellaceae bacterium]|nr:hypothetical protein [Stellaceae bacterium]